MVFFRIFAGIFMYLLCWESVSFITFIVNAYILSMQLPRYGNEMVFSIGLLIAFGSWVLSFVIYILPFAAVNCIILEIMTTKKNDRYIILISLTFGVICGVFQWLTIAAYLWEGANLYFGVPAFTSSVCAGYLIGIFYEKVLLQF